jgi:hypothetical protein
VEDLNRFRHHDDRAIPRGSAARVAPAITPSIVNPCSTPFKALRFRSAHAFRVAFGP